MIIRRRIQSSITSEPKFKNHALVKISVYEALKVVDCGFIFLPRGSIIS